MVSSGNYVALPRGGNTKQEKIDVPAGYPVGTCIFFMIPNEDIIMRIVVGMTLMIPKLM